MVKRLLVILILLTGYEGFAQKSAEFKRQQFIFEKASLYNDPTVATVALYNMLSLEPNNLELLDSLSIFYLNYDNFTSALIIAKEASSRNPNNELALEIAGLCFENLRMKDRAIAEYESLFLKNNNVFTLYKIALLQYDLERFNECITSTDILLKRKETEVEKVVFTKNDENKTEIEIGIRAAIHNLKGMSALKLKQPEQAKENFRKALEIAPEFDLAKQNLAEVK